MEGSANERLDFGKMGYGCKHYRRRCKIRAPCCNEVFDCRHCHNESTSMLSSPFDQHELFRSDVKQVICSVCDTEQPVARVCTNCGVNMGEYFCEVCKFYDDDVASFPFDDHNCPIQLIISFCHSAYSWLKEDIENVVVVHCKAGMARTGLMIFSLLLYLKFFPTAEESIDYYNQKRCIDGKGLVLPKVCQIFRTSPNILQWRKPAWAKNLVDPTKIDR